MSDRFYFQQQQRRRRNMAWTDESKAEAVELYTTEDPTPETSMEIVKTIADTLGESPNGVRMILTKAGVYVKKAPATSSAKSNGGGRVSKADSQQTLKDALSDAGQDIDGDIIDLSNSPISGRINGRGGSLNMT